jgi:transcriptional regulator with XRE-family HTH domain
MPRQTYTKEEKIREGRQVDTALHLANKTQESLANDLGVTQGLVHQWISGKTRIPDLYMLKLGKALSFDPISVRPELAEYAEFFTEETLLSGLSHEDSVRMKAAIHAFKKSAAK